MATLKDILNNNRKRAVVNGQLVDTSEEELQSIAKASGSPIPTTPQETGVIGASPDAAKMAGTPGQTQVALRANIQGQNDLGTAQRTQQPRKVANQVEQTSQQRSAQLQGLGDLQSRVQQLADKQINQALTQAPIQPQINTEALLADLANQPVQVQQQIQAALGKAAQGTASPADYQQIASALGYNPANIAELKDKIGKYFQPASDQIANQLTTAVPGQVTVGSLSKDQLQSLGFNSLGALTNLLGLPNRDALKNMTIEQLQEQVQKVQQEDYNQTRALEQRAADPALSEAERQQATHDLRQLGAVGTQASEQDMQNLNSQLENADQVSFNGQQYTVGDILSDDFLKATVKAYIDNPEAAAQLKEKEPELSTWIDQNRAALEKSVQSASQGAQSVIDKQIRNQALAKVGDYTVPDEVMKQIYPDWGSISNAHYSPKGILTVLNNSKIPEDYRQGVQSAIGAVSSLDPVAATQLANMDYSALIKAGFTKPEDFQDYISSLRVRSVVNSAPPEALIDQLFGGVARTDLNNTIKSVNDRRKLGLIRDSEVPPLVKILDANKDGLMDSPKSIQARLQTYTKTAGPAALNIFRSINLENPNKSLTQVAGTLGSKDDYYAKVAPLIQDGQIDKSDLQSLVKQGLTSQQFSNLEKIKMIPQSGSSLINSMLVERDITNPLANLGFKFGAKQALTPKQIDQASNLIEDLKKKYKNNERYLDALEAQQHKLKLSDIIIPEKLDTASPKEKENFFQKYADFGGKMQKKQWGFRVRDKLPGGKAIEGTKDKIKNIAKSAVAKHTGIKL